MTPPSFPLLPGTGTTGSPNGPALANSAGFDATFGVLAVQGPGAAPSLTTTPSNPPPQTSLGVPALLAQAMTDPGAAGPGARRIADTYGVPSGATVEQVALALPKSSPAGVGATAIIPLPDGSITTTPTAKALAQPGNPSLIEPPAKDAAPSDSEANGSLAEATVAVGSPPAAVVRPPAPEQAATTPSSLEASAKKADDRAATGVALEAIPTATKAATASLRPIASTKIARAKTALRDGLPAISATQPPLPPASTLAVAGPHDPIEPTATDPEHPGDDDTLPPSSDPSGAPVPPTAPTAAVLSPDVATRIQPPQCGDRHAIGNGTSDRIAAAGQAPAHSPIDAFESDAQSSPGSTGLADPARSFAAILIKHADTATPPPVLAPQPLVTPIQGPGLASAAPTPPPSTAPTAVPTPAANTVTVTPTPGQLGHDIGVAIARHVSADGGEAMTVRLDPRELGRIEVRMQFDDDGLLRAVVSADNPASLDLLRRDSADLNRALGDVGVRADQQSLRFDTRAGGGGQHGNSDSQPRQHQPANSRYADDVEAVPTEPVWRPLIPRGRVDLMA